MVNLVVTARDAIGLYPESSGLSASGVTGDIEADSLITLTPLGGETFGTADIQCVLFDDFRGQTNGARLSLNAVLGTWNNNSVSATCSTDQSKLGSGRSYYHPGSGVMNFNFEPSQGFRGSFWMYTPTDPANVTGGRSKTSWVMDTNGGSSTGPEIDLAWPTKHYTQDYGWGISGNDFNLQLSIGRWLYGAEWGRAMFSFSWENGWRCVLVAPTAGMLQVSKTENVFRFDAETTSTTVDWWKFGSTTDPTYYFDGIMCHTGMGANACVEIGDAQQYTECIDLFDLQINSWESEEIQAVIRAPSAFLTAGKYIHIHDANRNHIGGGLGRLIS
jgi:hypothetical protein